ncbi:hypothetical protein CR513_39228, partial [Mucuna pruriens]
QVDVSIIFDTTKIIKGSTSATILLYKGTKSNIDISHRNLLSYNEIHLNGYHVEKKNIKTKKILVLLFYGLYYMYVSAIETYTIVNQKVYISK